MICREQSAAGSCHGPAYVLFVHPDVERAKPHEVAVGHAPLERRVDLFGEVDRAGAQYRDAPVDDAVQVPEDLLGSAAAQGFDVETGVGDGADKTVVGLAEQVPLHSQDM
jgi:hypothetical protein